MEEYEKRMLETVTDQWDFSMKLVRESPNQNQFFFNYFYLKGELAMAKHLPWAVYEAADVSKYRAELEDLWTKWVVTGLLPISDENK